MLLLFWYESPQVKTWFYGLQILFFSLDGKSLRKQQMASKASGLRKSISCF